jgi:hypothetical protein
MTPADMWQSQFQSDTGAETSEGMTVMSGLKLGLGLAAGVAVFGLIASFVTNELRFYEKSNIDILKRS